MESDMSRIEGEILIRKALPAHLKAEAAFMVAVGDDVEKIDITDVQIDQLT